MPSCGNITSGYTRSCENIASGIKNIWLANYSDVTVWSAATNDTIVGATSAPTFFKYEIREGTCSAGEEIVANAQWGSKNIRQNLELVFIGQGQNQRSAANDLLGARLTALYQNEEGKYILYGTSKALEVNAGTGTNGVQAGEENTIKLTISGLSNEFAPTVSSTYAAVLTA